MRHKFVPFPQPLPNGAWGGCESCGALNNAGVPGCIADEAPAPGNSLLLSKFFIKLLLYY